MRAEGRYQIEMNFAKDAVLMKSHPERDSGEAADGANFNQGQGFCYSAYHSRSARVFNRRSMGLLERPR